MLDDALTDGDLLRSLVDDYLARRVARELAPTRLRGLGFGPFIVLALGGAPTPVPWRPRLKARSLGFTTLLHEGAR